MIVQFFQQVERMGVCHPYNYALPSIISYNGIKLKEFPINTFTFFKQPFIFSGGGYFRLFPYNCIKNFTLQSEYVMAYFHPRDFDIDQQLLKTCPFLGDLKLTLELKIVNQSLKIG